MGNERLTLTVEEAAKLLGIGRQLAYDRVKTGDIPVIKIGRRLVVPRRALEKLLFNLNQKSNYFLFFSKASFVKHNNCNRYEYLIAP